MRRINQKHNPYKPKKPRLFQFLVFLAAGITLVWLAASIFHISQNPLHTHQGSDKQAVNLNLDVSSQNVDREVPKSDQVVGVSASTKQVTQTSRSDDASTLLATKERNIEADFQNVEQVDHSADDFKTQEVATRTEPQPSNCPPDRKPYHFLLTAQSSNYQNWQALIMYYHFQKQQRLNPCTEMVNFTRLVATKDGKPDEIAHQIPSIFYKAIDEQELAAKYGSFGVLNRPHTMVQFVNDAEMWESRIPEEYVFVAETDHVLFKDIPNLATETTPVGYKFGYMRQNPGFQGIIQRHWPQGSWDKVDQTGPSPIIIHKKQLAAVAAPWLKFSLALKQDPQADHAFGWVLEMWGYTIAAASIGIKHKVLEHFQIEPANLNRLQPDFWKQYYIYHYTYGIEYTMQGEPMMNTIGEWSLDKRHYGASYPPRNLQPPPNMNAAAKNAAALWLVTAFNEATANIPEWPTFPTLGTLGWRREAVKHHEIVKSRIATEIMKPSQVWTWAGVQGMKFLDDGKLITPWGEGKWGLRNDEFNCPEPRDRCVFADFSSASHNLYFDSSSSFISMRVGDGEKVYGKLVLS